VTTPNPAPLVTISLDTEIGGWDYDPETGEAVGPGSTIANAIVHQAATRLVGQLKDAVAKAAVAKVDQQITEQVRELVAAVLAEPFRVTTPYGAAGQPTTIRERIAEQVAKELKPASRDSYSSDKPVITAVIEREVQAALTTELTAVIQAARDKVVTAVRDQAADLIAKAVKDGLR
jgi:hypothetical protein